MVNASQSPELGFENGSLRSAAPFPSEQQERVSYDRQMIAEQLRHNRFVASHLAQSRPASPLWQRSSHRSNLYTQSALHAHSEALEASYSPSSSHSPPPPVQPQHRVYVLRCAHCDTFISNRGMRAVLLLRPHVTLFSTDASPSNCGSLYSSNDEEPESETEQVERTCDCLTQSLACFCCGNVIGYQIVVPCTRCTASVGRNNQRASNGHRYVFHPNEVTYSERKYCPGERDIVGDFLECSGSATSTPQRSPSPTFTQGQYTNDSDSKEAFPPASRLWLTASNTTVYLPQARRRLLQLDDTIYWHHLRPAGELGSPVDPRSRTLTWQAVGR